MRTVCTHARMARHPAKPGMRLKSQCEEKRKGKRKSASLSLPHLVARELDRLERAQHAAPLERDEQQPCVEGVPVRTAPRGQLEDAPDALEVARAHKGDHAVALCVGKRMAAMDAADWEVR